MKIQKVDGNLFSFVSSEQEELDMDPYSRVSLVNMGTTHYEEGRLDEAEECYRKAIAVYPQCSLAYFNLGNILEERKMFNEAMGQYRRAVSIKPDYGDAHFNLALLYSNSDIQSLEYVTKAITHFKLYLKFCGNGPEEIYKKWTLREIDRLRNTICPKPPSSSGFVQEKAASS